jgi:hypothetical protein
MSAADVIAKGKAEGIKVSRSLVHMVRTRSSVKAKKGATKAPPTKQIAAPVTSATSKTQVAKPTAAPAKPPKSKADFVRAYPGLSPKEVVEKAAAVGIKLGWRYVYNVRATNKATRKAKKGAAKVTTSTTTSVNGAAPSFASPVTTSSAEDLLRAIAAELGLRRAVEILTEERARVRAVIGGDRLTGRSADIWHSSDHGVLAHRKPM